MKKEIRKKMNKKLPVSNIIIKFSMVFFFSKIMTDSRMNKLILQVMSRS